MRAHSSSENEWEGGRNGPAFSLKLVCAPESAPAQNKDVLREMIRGRENVFWDSVADVKWARWSMIEPT